MVAADPPSIGGTPAVRVPIRHGMAFRRRPLLQSVQRHMMFLERIVRLLDKKIDKLFLKSSTLARHAIHSPHCG